MVFMLPDKVRGIPEAGLASFLTSKASLIGLARTLALELGPEGILVNSIACPFDLGGPAVASGRPIRPVDACHISSAISFLISPDSSFITGKTLDVNGGSSML